VIVLDFHFWLPGWAKPSEAEWREKQNTLLAGDGWIADGTTPPRSIFDSSEQTQSYSSTRRGGCARGAPSCVGYDPARLTSSCQAAATSPVFVSFAMNGGWFGASGESTALSAKGSCRLSRCTQRTWLSTCCDPGGPYASSWTHEGRTL